MSPTTPRLAHRAGRQASPAVIPTATSATIPFETTAPVSKRSGGSGGSLGGGGGGGGGFAASRRAVSISSSKTLNKATVASVSDAQSLPWCSILRGAAAPAPISATRFSPSAKKRTRTSTSSALVI